MLRWTVLGAVLVAALAAASACRSSLDTFTCGADRDCQLDGLDGVCEASQVCSFADRDCLSGRRYGKLAGGLSDSCVLEDGEGEGLDASLADAADVEDADVVAPDADKGAIADAAIADAAIVDAQVDAFVIDGGPLCEPVAEADDCPAIDCGGVPCCVYQSQTSTSDCNDICEGANMNCEAAFGPVGNCITGPSRSCGSNIAGNICYCL